MISYQLMAILNNLERMSFNERVMYLNYSLKYEWKGSCYDVEVDYISSIRFIFIEYNKKIFLKRSLSFLH
jgi:hypothetical protein